MSHRRRLSRRGGVCTVPRVMQKHRFFALSLSLCACGNEVTTTVTDSGQGSSSTGAETTTTTTTNPTTAGPTTEAPTTGPGSSSTTEGPTTGTTGDETTGTSGEATGSSSGGESTGSSSGGETTGGSTEGSSGSSGSSGSTGDTEGDKDDTIYEIQDGTIPEKAAVSVKGVIVSGVNPGFTAFFAQEPGGGPYSGVWVYVGKMGPNIMGLAVGDEVDIVGSTLEFDGLTEIDASLGSVTKTGVGGLPLVPEVLPLATFADPAALEPWEGVLVRVEGQLAVTELPGFEEFWVAQNPDKALVDNLLYSVVLSKADFPQFGVGAGFTAIQGPINFSFMNYKIAPRSKADLEGYTPSPDPVLGVEDLVPGDLVITEVMYDPTCAMDDCEWFEVHNKTTAKVDLNGLVVQDNQQNAMSQGKVNVPAVVPPGGYAVLAAKTMATWPYPNPPLAFFGANPALGNGGDQVFIKNSKGTLDSIPAWTDKGALDNGVSWKLDPTKTDSVQNDSAMNWCYSTVNFWMMEKGSPAAANEAACLPI